MLIKQSNKKINFFSYATVISSHDVVSNVKLKEDNELERSEGASSCLLEGTI
jgi:VIT1/CCC1 family predicted Fe2+/Mn2+ transporter